MPFVILLTLVIGAALVAWYFPQLRTLALVILAMFGGLLGYLFFSSGSETDRQSLLIPVDEVELSQLEFVLEPRPSHLSGNMLNSSDSYHLRNVEMRVTLHDCAEAEMDLSDCIIIADDTANARVDIPAGQLRRFRLLLQFPNIPQVEGTLRWQYFLLSTRATGQS